MEHKKICAVCSCILLIFLQSSHLISLSKFNHPLIGTFTWPTTYRGRELNYGSHTYFFDHTRTWRTSPDEWSAQCRGHLRHSTNMKDNTPQAHTQVIPTRRMWNDDDDGQMIFGDLGGVKFPDICLTGEEKPRKNLTQETCPDRGSNPGPLRDKRACYHLLYSGGLVV